LLLFWPLGMPAEPTEAQHRRQAREPVAIASYTSMLFCRDRAAVRAAVVVLGLS
jgi:hypothetical protein